MKISMIGHSTVLIEIGGQKILTDPYFGMAGNRLFERVAPPAVTHEALGVVDVVLLSHNHWDHVDPPFFHSQVVLSLSQSLVLTPKAARRYV